MVLKRHQIAEIEDAILEAFKRPDFQGAIMTGISVALEKLIAEQQVQIQKVTQENEQLKKTCEELNKHIFTVNKRMEYLDAFSRRNNIRIFGVHEDQGENTLITINKIFENMKINDLNQGSVDHAFRLGKKREKHTRPIMVIFNNKWSRDLVYTNKKNLKGSKIIIREDLTKNKMDLVKSAIEKFGARNVWTNHGQVTIKDRNGQIKHLSEANQLERICEEEERDSMDNSQLVF